MGKEAATVANFIWTVSHVFFFVQHCVKNAIVLYVHIHTLYMASKVGKFRCSICAAGRKLLAGLIWICSAKLLTYA